MYRYGMRLRGFSIGCQPMDGLVERQDDTSGKYHDILVYDRELTKQELEEYELDKVKGEQVMRYRVSTTTHRSDGSQIDNWKGDYIEAESKADAIAEEAEWEARLLKEDDVSDVKVDGDKVFFTRDGERLYLTVYADEA